MSGELHIYASNVHQGGGRSLLEALLSVAPRGTSALLDVRMPVPDAIRERLRIIQVQPSVMNRLRADRRFGRKVGVQDTVICFGNLPPLFKVSGRVIVFIQNRYLICHHNLEGLPLRVRVRLIIERTWLKFLAGHASEFVVQTPSMQSGLRDFLGEGVPVRVIPFVADPVGYKRSVQVAVTAGNQYDYVYVASGEPHKNHRNLVEAWVLLAKEKLYPSLCLTLDENRFPGLCCWIESVKSEYRLNIMNMGALSYEDVGRLYRKSGALIYPSVFESFGLPLIEARQSGLQVLASELDFVRDAIDPEETFDPDSPLSIARAVKRHCGVGAAPLPLMDAASFLVKIQEVCCP